jgi:hypothetical protein
MIQDINKNFSTLKEALGQSIIFHVSSQTSLEYIVKQGIALVARVRASVLVFLVLCSWISPQYGSFYVEYITYSEAATKGDLPTRNFINHSTRLEFSNQLGSNVLIYLNRDKCFNYPQSIKLKRKNYLIN